VRSALGPDGAIDSGLKDSGEQQALFNEALRQVAGRLLDDAAAAGAPAMRHCAAAAAGAGGQQPALCRLLDLALTLARGGALGAQGFGYFAGLLEEVIAAGTAADFGDVLRSAAAAAAAASQTSRRLASPRRGAAA